MKTPALETAVLFIVFNRPETTLKVFEAISQAKPARLYIASDGPRAERNEDREKIKRVREIATAVNWSCEVFTLFRETNLGCKQGPINAITWFFDHEEQGIILEDDCLPSQSFFTFCNICLTEYKHDLRVWDIAGSNSLMESYLSSFSSYTYSYYGEIWGWATWRDRWQFFDADLITAKKFDLFDFVLQHLDKRELPKLRRKQFNRILNGLDAWDYQWLYNRISNSGLSVVPSVNLVSNIGFGEDATHTLTPNVNSDRQRFELTFPLVSPRCMVRDKKRDIEYVQRYVKPPLMIRIKRVLLSLLILKNLKNRR